MMSSFRVALTGQSLIKKDVRHIRQEQFWEVLDLLKQADVVFTNFESTILGQYGGWPTKGRYFDYSRPEVLDTLQSMGFNTLALANNHAFDLGPAGILSTLSEVWSRGFLHAGIGTDETDATKPGRRQFGGRNVTLFAMDAGPGPANMYAENRTASRPSRPGVNRLKTLRTVGVPVETFRSLGMLSEDLRTSPIELVNYVQPDDPVPPRDESELNFYGTLFRQAADFGRFVEVDRDNLDQHLSAMRRAAGRGDFVIAYLHHHHWEAGWQDVPAWVQDFARSCIDAGADLFVSHGAPVLQALEIYNSCPIFYGLGNFLFHVPPEETEWSAPEVWQSIVATCRYAADGALDGIDLLPIVLGDCDGATETGTSNRLVPLAATGSVAAAILEGFAARSRRFGTEIAVSAASACVSIDPPLRAGKEPIGRTR